MKTMNEIEETHDL